jgi:hypothetical protein
MPTGPASSRNVAFVPGDRLAEWLQSQPLHPRPDLVARAVTALNSESFKIDVE